MGRILAIDYGEKRAGIAVTDPERIIAGGLETVSPESLIGFLETYTRSEKVDIIVIGYPLTLQNKGAQILKKINPFIKKLIKRFPDIEICTHDERFTSKMAQMSILQGGVKKKKRQDKALTDKVSAAIILQSYMDSLKFQQK